MKREFFAVLAVLIAGWGCMEPVSTVTPEAVLRDENLQVVAQADDAPEAVPVDDEHTGGFVCTVQADAVHVRESATEHSPAVGWLYRGDAVQIAKVEGVWGAVDGGWMRLDAKGARCRGMQ